MYEHSRRTGHGRSYRTPALPAFGLVLVALLTACSGGSGGGGGLNGLVADFVDGGNGMTANRVRLTGSPSGDQVTVNVVIGGPTTSGDLYSFAFDLVLGNPAVARYENGSATLGGALTLSGGQTAEVLAVQAGSRVTVGVTKLGGGTGNPVMGGEPTIVTLRFRLLTAGSTTLAIEGSPPFDPAAVDSDGNDVPSVSFDTTTALLMAS